MWMIRNAFLLGLLGLATLPVGATETLGRLFMTPEQRQSLDALRETGSDVQTDASRLLMRPATTPAAGKVVLNGVMRRSLGPDVVWVNGNRTRAADAGVRLHRGPDGANRVTLEAPANGTSARLKPGQYWEPSTGTVANCYGCTAPAKPAESLPPSVEVTADQP